MKISLNLLEVKIAIADYLESMLKDIKVRTEDIEISFTDYYGADPVVWDENREDENENTLSENPKGDEK